VPTYRVGVGAQKQGMLRVFHHRRCISVIMSPNCLAQDITFICPAIYSDNYTSIEPAGHGFAIFLGPSPSAKTRLVRRVLNLFQIMDYFSF